MNFWQIIYKLFINCFIICLSYVTGTQDTVLLSPLSPPPSSPDLIINEEEDEKDQLLNKDEEPHNDRKRHHAGDEEEDKKKHQSLGIDETVPLSMVKVVVSDNLFEKYNNYMHVWIPSHEECINASNEIEEMGLDEIMCKGDCEGQCKKHIYIIHFKKPIGWKNQISTVFVTPQILKEKTAQFSSGKRSSFFLYLMTINDIFYILCHFSQSNDDVFAVICKPDGEKSFSAHPSYEHLGLVFYRKIYDLQKSLM